MRKVKDLYRREGHKKTLTENQVRCLYEERKNGIMIQIKCAAKKTAREDADFIRKRGSFYDL